MAKTPKGEQLEIGDTLKIKMPLMGIAVTDDLKPHPQNYVEHPEDQIKHLKTSLVNSGFYRNIVVCNENYILAGHGIWTAAKELGMENVPIVKVDLDPFSPDAIRILIGDNEVRHLVVADDRGLADMMIDLSKDGGSLEGTGWDQMMLANFAMVTRDRDEIQDLAHAQNWVGMPNFERVFRPLTMTIHVRSEEDRFKVLELLGFAGMKITKRMVLWWPPAAIQSPMDLKFMPEELIQENPSGPSPLQLAAEAAQEQASEVEIPPDGNTLNDGENAPEVAGSCEPLDAPLLVEPENPIDDEILPVVDLTPEDIDAIEEIGVGFTVTQEDASEWPNAEEDRAPESEFPLTEKAASSWASTAYQIIPEEKPEPEEIDDLDGMAGDPVTGPDVVLTPDDEIEESQPSLFESTPADRYTS